MPSTYPDGDTNGGSESRQTEGEQGGPPTDDHTPPDGHRETLDEAGTQTKSRSPPAKRLSSQLHSQSRHFHVPSALHFLDSHIHKWESWKIVLRCALAAWVGLLFIIINRTRTAMGSSAYLILITVVVAPPAEPLIVTVEQTVWIIFISAVCYAWGCLEIWLAWIARGPGRLGYDDFISSVSTQLSSQGYGPADIPSEIQRLIETGTFLDWRASGIFLSFSALSAGAMMWLKASLGAGPASTGMILPLILGATIGIYGALYPWPNYGLGSSFWYPVLIQLGINLFFVSTVWPQSLQGRFLGRLADTLVPLRDVVAFQRSLLATNPVSAQWVTTGASMKTEQAAAAQRLASLGLSARSLTHELCVRRINGKDVKLLYRQAGKLITRVSGLVRFYTLIVNRIHREGALTANPFVVHLTPTRKTSPRVSFDNGTHASLNQITPSRSPSRSLLDVQEGKALRLEGTQIQHPLSRPTDLSTDPQESQHALVMPHGTRPRSAGASPSLHTFLHDKLDRIHRRASIAPVSLYESQRYALLETQIAAENDEHKLEELVALLHDASFDLIGSLDEALAFVIASLRRLKRSSGLIQYYRHPGERTAEEHLKSNLATRQALHASVEDFRKKREALNRPFAHLFDPQHQQEPHKGLDKPTRRGWYWIAQYAFSLTELAVATEEFLRDIEVIDVKRTKLRMWLPSTSSLHIFARGHDGFEALHAVDQNPEEVPGLHDLPETTHARDPDYAPPSSTVQILAEDLHALFHRLSRPDVQFACKGAVLVALLQLPAHFKSSAGFFFYNRGLWVIIGAQVALQQHIGDTLFQLYRRTLDTFAGAVVGMVIWYIGCGGGRGSPYGLSVICAATFPAIMAFRLWYPVQLQSVVTCIVIFLIIGYSWQDAHTSDPIHTGWGWDVAYRRFLTILIGITAAFLWSFVPPTGSSQKETIRRIQAKTLTEIGNLFCASLNYANELRLGHKRPSKLIDNATALRGKLLATTSRKKLVRFEWTLRGAWPETRYDKILELQIEMIDLVAQLTSIFAILPPAWTHCLFLRTHLADPRFMGDITSTFALLSTSLRSSAPLPTFFTPLLETAFGDGEPYAFETGLRASEHSDSIPRHVSLATLCDPDYQHFAVAGTTILSFLNRLDQLVAVIKELVGERYAVYGLTGYTDRTGSHELLMSRTETQSSVSMA